jgi:hypothetical protein
MTTRDKGVAPLRLLPYAVIEAGKFMPAAAAVLLAITTLL